MIKNEKNITTARRYTEVPVGTAALLGGTLRGGTAANSTEIAVRESRKLFIDAFLLEWVKIWAVA